MAKQKLGDGLRPMAAWGFIADAGKDGTNGEQAQGVCPFCGYVNSKGGTTFFADPTEGLWDCKACLRKGNAATFLEQILDLHAESTTTEQIESLAKGRGLPLAAFPRHEVAHAAHGPGGRPCYLFPTKAPNGRVVDLRHWRPGGAIQSTWGVKVGLWGADRLADAPPEAVVYVCEGEWDGMALDWLARAAGRSETVCVVATPGAGTFKHEWSKLFARRRVVFCYDADHSGDVGMSLAAGRISSSARKVRYLRWPADIPDGFDVRDLISGGLEGNRKPAAIWKTVQAYLSDTPRGKPGESSQESRAAAGMDVQPSSWHETINRYRELVEMTPDLEAATKVMFAAVFSSQLQDGDPLWIWLVGPPSSGKTMLAMSLRDSERCEFVSTIKENTLVSGFPSNQGDPSLLPKLAGRCLVVKEGTQILQLPPVTQDVVFSTLRDAYDGCVQRHYGNGIFRSYDVRFSFFGAVTNAIHGHGNASMGERCLKLQLETASKKVREQVMDAVYEGATDARRRDEGLREAASRFLANPFPKSMEDVARRVPEGYRTRLKGLAEIVAWLRSPVSYERYKPESLGYRPAREAPNRILSQLFRLAGLLAFVVGEETLSEANYAIVERVAFDTAIGWHAELVSYMATDPERAWTRRDIIDGLGLPSSNVWQAQKDLELKGLLVRTESEGGGPVARIRFTLHPELVEHWNRANVNGSALPAAFRAAGARRRRTRKAGGR